MFLLENTPGFEAEFQNQKLISVFSLNIYVHATTQQALCKFRQWKNKQDLYGRYYLSNINLNGQSVL